MLRSAPSGESSHGEVEAAPEKMNRTALAAKIRPKLLEDAVALQKDAPEPVRVFGIVGGILLVPLDGNRGIDLVRRRLDLDRQLELAERAHHLVVKVRDGLRLQTDGFFAVVAGLNSQNMINEIEVYLKNTRRKESMMSNRVP
jgi:hypothetical protein